MLSSAQRHTHFPDSPRIAAAMARSDFRWRDLRDGAGTVFLVLPSDRMGAYSRWLRLLVAQPIAELARTPQRPGTPPVLLLLDEFAALGRLEPVLSAATFLAHATVEYVTSSSGSSSPTGWFPTGGGSVSAGTSTHLAGQPLLTPDEAMRLPPHLQVLLRLGKPPALARKLRHYEDPEFRGLTDG